MMSEEEEQTSVNSKREGAVLILSMALILVLSALAVSTAAISRANAHIASDQRKVASALASAASGLEVNRYWLSRVMMPSSTPPCAYLSTIVHALQDDLASNNISDMTVSQTGFLSAAIPDSPAAQCFTGQILVNPANPSVLQVYSTAGAGRLARTIGVCFDIESYAHPIFTFSLATKGPLKFAGNPTLRAANAAREANLYVEGSNSPGAPALAGHADFDGDVMIAGPAAGVNVEFPIPDIERFRQYATGETIDSSSDLSSGMILTNATITAGTNPHFTGHVTIEGILFIESPNVVTFGRDVALAGLIVAAGDVDNPGTNRIDFCGNFSSGPYPDRADFDAIRGRKGSSILAPGFATSFGGHFSTLEGVVAVSGVRFSGNVNAVIRSTIINYCESPLIIEGNAVMNIDRHTRIKVPAGFDTHRVLTYNPSSYEEFAM
ncbi:MAG: hypothetical protein JSW66_15245 [Phycisphaerales bacterium]|nr:MAG: hypothetical protein JSW66_15245 [Phycisphaerales bacterium]